MEGIAVYPTFINCTSSRAYIPPHLCDMLLYYMHHIHKTKASIIVIITKNKSEQKKKKKKKVGFS